jgi:hypothetical protein
VNISEQNLGHFVDRTSLAFTGLRMEGARLAGADLKDSNHKNNYPETGNSLDALIRKSCAQEDDLRTFLGEFVPSLPQVELPVGMVL